MKMKMKSPTIKLMLSILPLAMATPTSATKLPNDNYNHNIRNQYLKRLLQQQRQQRKQQSQQDEQQNQQYQILKSPEILSRLLELTKNYPNFATLTTTQEWFDLPRAGTTTDCPHDATYDPSNPSTNGPGCNNYVLIVQDKEAYPDDSDVVQLSSPQEREFYLSQEEDGWWDDVSQFDDLDGGGRSGWKYLPDVFLSGSVHGDERVGPTSLVEMTELLLESAYCESLPRRRYQPRGYDWKNNGDSKGEGGGGRDDDPNPDMQQWKEELMTAHMCRESLTNKGIPPSLRKWMARLVATRRTVIIPTANALGYARNNREEDGIDPNRDFPFDIQPAFRSRCMQTIAGRSINELFRSHLFPIGLTFHGGMEVIGYEWGAPTYLNRDAPDAAAQNAIAGAYSRYANGFPGHRAYDYGTMNDKVYYVRGGMEDWAFAGSWDPDRVVECAPTTFGGNYPAEKTRYNNSTLRAFNMLVETSDIKNPPQNQLGTRNQPLMSSNGQENGHIARNIRLALVAMDVVEPYVSIQGVEDLQLEDDDVIPSVNMRRYNGGSYFENSRMVWVPQNRKDFRITWTVGGSFDIDFTEIVYGPWEALPQNLADDRDGFYPSLSSLETLNSHDFATVSPTNIDKNHGGRSRWHEQGPFPTSSSQDIPGPFFETMIDVSKYSPGTKLAVFAKAKVDKAWLTPAANVGPSGLGPVSHIVNARNNPSYFASNAGKIIKGRKDSWWYSAPVTLVLGSEEDGVRIESEATANNAPVSSFDGRVRAVYLNSRLGSVQSMMEVMSRGSFGMTTASIQHSSGLSMPFTIGTLTIVLGLIGLVVMQRKKRRYAQRSRLEQDMEEEEGFSVEIAEGGYHDDVNTSLESIRID